MYQYNIQLKEYNSFRTEALAKVFCAPKDITELKQCIIDHKYLPKLVLGKGCNLFFTKNFDGLVIKPDSYGIREVPDESDDSEYIFIEAKAAEDWDDFVNFCVERGYSGLENLSYIPGTVGAAPIQNIGAYGSEVKDSIHEVIALDMETLEVLSFSNAECEFAYRDSLFKRANKYVIISVVFLLKRSFTYTPKYTDLIKELEGVDSPTLKQVREAIIRIRQRKLPDEKVLPNCGSFFKNPYIAKEKADELKKVYPDLPLYPINEGLVKVSAAFLIDRAGFKGKQTGQIGTYPNQALIVVNHGSGKGTDIIAFMQEIQEAVLQQFDIQLEPEVRIL